ncbi:MAG: hypothetical protein KJ018_22570, partial [Burkholderiales bacterium]|nr:hypothetical protein [Burkholderiales bacterium]
MANLVTNKLKYELMTGDANLDAADLRVLLLTTTGSVTPDTNVVNDIVANELAVSGYARQAIAGETVTEDDANDFAYLDATDATFSALATGATIGWAALLRQVTNDTDSPVYAGYDVTDTPTNGSDQVIQWATPVPPHARG